MRYKLLILLVVFAALAATLVIGVHHKISTWYPLASAPAAEIEIPAGMLPRDLVAFLPSEDERVRFFSPLLFDIYTRIYYRQGRVLQAGYYELTPDENYRQWLRRFEKGMPRLVNVTVPEGWNIYDIAGRLHKLGVLEDEEKFVRLAFDDRVLRTYDILPPSVEGYLYPTTYRMPPHYPASKIIRDMIKMYRAHVEVQNFEIRHPYLSTHHDYVILASIIEKETGVDEERGLVSSVFHNRLKRRMRLQSDPTTIYGIPGFTGRLRRRHLDAPSDYNTYQMRGLPLGPICSPGLASIRAAYFPDKTDYLFFVSRNDGTHVFSATYREHNRNVDIYQRGRPRTRTAQTPDQTPPSPPTETQPTEDQSTDVEAEAVDAEVDAH